MPEFEIIRKTIRINAAPEKVWSVFADPQITRKMGGEYRTNWKPGSEFGWIDLKGKQLTKGKILQIVPGKLLRHDLVDIKNEKRLLSVITYKFHGTDTGTTISTTEELNYETNADDLKQASEGWDFALQTVKEIAEQI